MTPELTTWLCPFTASLCRAIVEVSDSVVLYGDRLEPPHQETNHRPTPPEESTLQDTGGEAAEPCSWCHASTFTQGGSTPPPLSFPTPSRPCRSPGGWGTVTWSTQNFSLRLIVLLCR